VLADVRLEDEGHTGSQLDESDTRMLKVIKDFNKRLQEAKGKNYDATMR
jgi:hypothetical protein